MDIKTFNRIIADINDCDNYLQGKVHSKRLAEIAAHAAKRVVIIRRKNLLDQLREAGLNLNEEA